MPDNKQKQRDSHHNDRMMRFFSLISWGETAIEKVSFHLGFKSDLTILVCCGLNGVLKAGTVETITKGSALPFRSMCGRFLASQILTCKTWEEYSRLTRIRPRFSGITMCPQSWRAFLAQPACTWTSLQVVHRRPCLLKPNNIPPHREQKVDFKYEWTSKLCGLGLIIIGFFPSPEHSKCTNSWHCWWQEDLHDVHCTAFLPKPHNESWQCEQFVGNLNTRGSNLWPLTSNTLFAFTALLRVTEDPDFLAAILKDSRSTNFTARDEIFFKGGTCSYAYGYLQQQQLHVDSSSSKS